jgi:hypothetical protein
MKVILDTNIIHSNFYLNTPRFLGLFDYLKKTKSKLIIPSFVFQEVQKKYKEELQTYSEREERDNRVLFNSKEKVDILSAEKEYALFWLTLAKDKKVSVPETKEFGAKRLFTRALQSMPPFDSSGRGIRDTLIWLNIVSLVKKSPKEYFCFITANSKDFGKTNLHPQLVEDLGENAAQLIYFNSLEEFLSSYGDKISFIDKKLFEDFFWDKDKYILSLIDEDKFSRSDIDELPRSCYLEGIEEMTVNNLDIRDFYIFSATESSYKVQLEMIVSLDLRVNISSEDDYDHNSTSVSGSTYCFIDISLVIDKETEEIKIDEEIPPNVDYP